MRAGGAGGTFNISTGREAEVLEIFEHLAEAAAVELEPRLEPLREGELERSCMDPSLAARVLGWRAKVDLETGLPATYHELVAQFSA